MEKPIKSAENFDQQVEQLARKLDIIHTNSNEYGLDVEDCLAFAAGILEIAAKDAARYRFLREIDTFDMTRCDPNFCNTIGKTHVFFSVPTQHIKENGFDAAIDAAMQSK